jgi:hypothetical protein
MTAPSAPANPQTDDQLLAVLREIIDAPHVRTDAAVSPFLTDWRGRYSGQALNPGNVLRVDCAS